MADANGNLDLNADDDKFEQIVTDKIKTSKQKKQLANANLNQQADLLSQHSFQSAHEDVDLEDMS